MKAVLIIVLSSWRFGEGAPTQQHIEMPSMEQCEAVKKHLLPIMEVEFNDISRAIPKMYCLDRGMDGDLK